MILEKQTEANILQQGQSQDSIGMSLDLDSAQILMQMLSKNLYSDSIGSTIRECASNALDSHRRAGVDKPIIVSFGRNSQDNYEFCVEDFGIGLDAEDVKNIISKYGKSTKRDSNTELGMMGLGFKAPLAYSSSFYFVCRKDGVERKYMMYEGEDVNTIDLLSEQPTSEGNGVKIIVPVKWNDRYDFEEKIKTQLAYFESVWFDVDGIDNNFSIHRNSIYQFSELAQDSRLHICLDNVYYPLDFDKLGIDPIRIPVGLRFSLTDGIFPTPNREALRYTQESKGLILAKIEEFADYVVGKYNESINGNSNINSIFDYYGNGDRYLNMISKSFNISGLLQYSTVPIVEPKLQGVELLNLRTLHKHREYLLQEYEVNYTIHNNVMRETKNRYWKSIVHATSVNDSPHYIYHDRIKGNTKLYLKDTLDKRTEVKIVKKKKSYKLGHSNSRGFDTYYEILELGRYPKSEWRAVIKEFQYVQSLFTSRFIDINSVVVPQAWLDNRKKQKVSVSGGSLGRTDANGKRIIKLQGEVVSKIAEPLQKWVDGKNCKWVPKTFKLEEIGKHSFLYVYASHDEAAKLDPLYKVFERQRVQFLTFSQRELNVLDKVEIHNLIPYSKFMEGNTKPFKRLITAYLIKRLMLSCRNLFSNKKHLQTVSDDLFQKLVLLDDYAYKNYYDSHETIYDAMLKVAEPNNLFDHEIYDVYKDVLSVVDKLPFLEPMMGTLRTYGQNEDLISAISDLFKYYKHKVNYTRYSVKLNEDQVEALTEETVEQLID